MKANDPITVSGGRPAEVHLLFPEWQVEEPFEVAIRHEGPAEILAPTEKLLIFPGGFHAVAWSSESGRKHTNQWREESLC